MFQPIDVALVKHDPQNAFHSNKIQNPHEIEQGALYYLVILHDMA